MEIGATAIPNLEVADIALVAELGKRRQVREGEYLYQAGDVDVRFLRPHQRRGRHRLDC